LENQRPWNTRPTFIPKMEVQSPHSTIFHFGQIKKRESQTWLLKFQKELNPISKADFLNPIKQDIKNGKLRYVALKYPFNYGALPQTWENPASMHPDTKAKGDNDPLDAVELSTNAAKTGDVKHVKILGTYAMIDEGETDWKVLVIDVNDPNAAKLNDAADIEKVLPGKLKEVFEFLRDYKIPDGKPPNQFAFNGELKDRAFAMKVVEETYGEWKRLAGGISIAHTVGDAVNRISKEEAEARLKPKM